MSLKESLSNRSSIKELLVKSKKNQSRTQSQQAPDISQPESEIAVFPGCEKSHFVDFDFYAPGAQSVSVAGTFNDWNSSQFNLKKDPESTWKGSLPLMQGSHQYRFFVDGNWADNPQAKEQIPNAYGGMNVILNVA